MDSVCPCLDHCLCTWITPLVKPSGYCSLIEDHARLLEYSSALPSIYLFAICSTLPVYLGMSINKSLHMDTHALSLIRPVTGSVLTSVIKKGQSQEDRPMAPLHREWFTASVAACSSLHAELVSRFMGSRSRPHRVLSVCVCVCVSGVCGCV